MASLQFRTAWGWLPGENISLSCQLFSFIVFQLNVQEKTIDHAIIFWSIFALTLTGIAPTQQDYFFQINLKQCSKKPVSLSIGNLPLVYRVAASGSIILVSTCK